MEFQGSKLDLVHGEADFHFVAKVSVLHRTLGGSSPGPGIKMEDPECQIQIHKNANSEARMEPENEANEFSIRL